LGFIDVPALSIQFSGVLSGKDWATLLNASVESAACSDFPLLHPKVAQRLNTVKIDFFNPLNLRRTMESFDQIAFRCLFVSFDSSVRMKMPMPTCLFCAKDREKLSG
jgi:hypothetical protein